MSSLLPPGYSLEAMLDLPELSDFDLQLAEQYLPLICGHYHQSLRLSDEAQGYLYRHYQIDWPEIETNQLGYSDRTLGQQLPYHKTDSGQMIRGALGHLRLYKGSGHERFRGCVTVPYLVNGNVHGFYGERIGRVMEGANPRYWAPIRTPCVFGLSSMQESSLLYLCRNPLAVIQLSQVFPGQCVAAGCGYQLYKEDCRYLAEQGVQELVVCCNSEDDSHHFKKLVRHLAAFDIKFHRTDEFTELSYGRA